MPNTKIDLRAQANLNASAALVTFYQPGLMSSNDKLKLNNIEENANKYIHPETHTANMIVEDATHRFVTDTEKTDWNAKAETTLATTTTAGLMAAADKTKLNSITAGAAPYTHPATHAASMITEDTTRRFVTDTEKSNWNAKLNATAKAVDSEKLDGLDSSSYLQIGATANTNGKFDTSTTASTGTQRLNYSGYFYATKVYNAVYNDYAEYFIKAEDMEPGDVIAINLDGEGYIKSKSRFCKTAVGVYSDDYAMCIGGEGDGNDEVKYASIGLAGKVRVKITGRIEKGMYIVSSDIEGVAMGTWEHVSGAILGIALETNEAEDIKRVLMLIKNM